MKQKIISWLLVICMILTIMPMTVFAETATSEVPELPIATLSKVENEDLTFALKVNPIPEEPNNEQFLYYAGWYADYEITVNKNVELNTEGETDGYLLCQNEKLSTVSLKENEPLRLIEHATKLAYGVEIRFTYEDMLNTIGEFEFGAFFEEEFLAANSNLEVKVELKMYNPNNLEESHVLASYTYPEKAPELPTATITKINKDDLTFAMNFKADDITDEQLAYYGDWYADFEFTANKDIKFNAAGVDEGKADGYLSGHYAEYGWKNVPITELNVTAGTSIKIMETAAATMGEPGLQYTFEEVYDAVKNFDCGVFFTDEFLAKNPDLEVSLELKLYETKDATEGYTIGGEYKFTATEAALPTATVTKVYNPNLTFAMNFKANEPTEDQLAKYGNWFADFEIKTNRDIVLSAKGVADGTADGYLSGEYGKYGWVNVPFEKIQLNAGESIKIMKTAAETMGEPGLKYTYKEVYELVKDFNCGMFLTDEFVAKNPDLKLTLELKLYSPSNENTGHSIGQSFVFTAKEASLPTATVTKIEKEGLTYALNFKANDATAEQLAEYGNWYADFEIKSNKNIVLNADLENNVADGYLSGQYDGWEIPGYDSSKWINVPFKESLTLEANKPLKIMEFAAEAMGEKGLKYTYKEVYEVVKDFNCGIFLTDEFLAANPDIEITLDLKLYNPNDEKDAYLIGETHKFEVPALPSAKATRIHNNDLTFAMNFKTEEISDAQLAYYKNWFADFELTVNKDITLHADYANKGADGYLSGQYDAWSENWVNVPFKDAVKLKAGETIKVMEFASELMGEPGLKYKFGEVYTGVQDFDCGMFFTDEFLAANPDLKVTLELKMYNPLDETMEYTIGNTYVFTKEEVMPALPTATVSDTVTPENPNLTFAKNFKVNEVTPDQLTYYEKWFADFELTVNKDVTLCADYENVKADGYLSGQYDNWKYPGLNPENWLNVPLKPVTLKANEPIKIMEFAAELLGEKGLKYTFKEVYEKVQDFDCGIFFTPEFLAANPDLKVTLELKMYNPEDENEGYVIGDTNIFTTDEAVAMNVQTGVVYTDVTEGLIDASTGQRVVLLRDVNTSMVTVSEGVTLDLDGYDLTTKYFSCYGNTVDYSEDNEGLLVVPKNRILMQKNNKQLPINNGEGYQFFEIVKYNQAMTSATKYVFQPLIEDAALDLLLNGAEATGVTVNARVSWKQTNGVRTQDFVYSDDFVSIFVDSYKPSTGKFGQMFTLTMTKVFDGLTFNAVMKSDTGVEISAK